MKSFYYTELLDSKTLFLLVDVWRLFNYYVCELASLLWRLIAQSFFVSNSFRIRIFRDFDILVVRWYTDQIVIKNLNSILEIQRYS